MNRIDMMKTTIRNMEIIVGNMPIGTKSLDKFHNRQLNLLIGYKNHLAKIRKAEEQLKRLESK